MGSGRVTAVWPARGSYVTIGSTTSLRPLSSPTPMAPSSSPPTTVRTDSSSGRATGTAAGTGLVKDINPGTSGSYPGDLTNVNGTLFFTADDGTHGHELWKSDGTAAGTVLVKDINPGGDRLGPQRADERQRHAVLHGRRRHARAGAVEERRHRRRHRPGQGHLPRQRRLVSQPSSDERERHAVLRGRRRRRTARELWKSDGTAAGTVLVKDINPGSGGSYPGDLTDVNGTLFFTADDGTHGERAVEERRHRRRHRPGQGHQPRQRWLVAQTT